MTKAEIKNRLEELRTELRAERISQGELVELQSLIPFINKDDVELLEAAGVPEFPKKFKVSMEKRYYQTGVIEVEAEDGEAALEKVHRMMDDQSHPLQTTDPRIEWTGEVTYEDGSFDTTGDVDEA